MTDIHAVIAELRALEEKATPGEWRQDCNGCGWIYTHPSYGNTSKIRCDSTHHAALISASRNALPQLLAYIDRLEAVASAARMALEDAQEDKTCVNSITRISRVALAESLDALDA